MARFCCEDRCVAQPENVVDGLACRKCGAYGYCKCLCKNRPIYCCADKCFVVPHDQVDGIACRVCESFSYCQCNCRNYKPPTVEIRLYRTTSYYTCCKRVCTTFQLNDLLSCGICEKDFCTCHLNKCKYRSRDWIFSYRNIGV